MEGKTRKENFIFHFRDLPSWIRQDPIAFHLLAEYARRTSRTGGDIHWHEEIIHLEPGQFITGRIKTSEILGITEGQYRGAFKRLVKTGSIQTIKVTTHYTICLFRADGVFHIVLGDNSPANEPPASPSVNQPLTTNNTVNTVKTVISDTRSQVKTGDESLSNKKQELVPSPIVYGNSVSHGMESLGQTMQRLRFRPKEADNG